MNFRFTQSLLVSSIALALAACGGGGGGSNSSPTPTVPTEPSKPQEPKPTEPEQPTKPTQPTTPLPKPTQNAPCAVTKAQWDKIEKYDDIEAVSAKLSCNGFKASITTNDDGENIEYRWGSNLKEPTIVTTFNEYKIRSLIYHLYPQNISTCMPVSTSVEKLKIGMTLADAEKELKCKGVLNYYHSNGDNISQYYLWKNDKEELWLKINSANKVEDLIYNPKETITPPKISKCVPKIEHWNRIKIDDKREDAKTVIGCDGIVEFEENSGGNKLTELKWGEYLKTELLSLYYLNDKLIYKIINYKDQNSSCLPDLSSWDQVKLMDKFSTSNFKCTPQLLYQEKESNEADSENSMYIWKDFLYKADDLSVPKDSQSFQLFVADDKIQEKILQNNKQPYSTCLPSEQEFKKYKINELWENFTTISKCAPKLSYSYQSPTSKISIYSWGSKEEATKYGYAYLIINNDGKIGSRSIQFPH